jgi:hypothetical protein
MLNELQIKAAVIQKLTTTEAFDDAVLINELVVDNWRRRVDIAMVNGRLHDFEIKSDLDSLKRLEGQIKTYGERFDKVTVVTTAKHLAAVHKQLPDNVEIWQAVARHGQVDIRISRRGRINQVSNKDTLYSFLTKAEILLFLRANGFSVTPEVTRGQLTTIGAELTLKEIRQHVLSCLKQRYACTSSAFMAARHRLSAAASLQHLSKSTLRRASSETSTGMIATGKTQGDRPRRQLVPLDLNRFREKYGAVPANMPAGILGRVSRSDSM